MADKQGPSLENPALQLLAEDAEDLKVISAALQDAVGAIGDIRYEKSSRRLTIAFNRFRWEAGAAKGGERVRAALQLGGVLDLKALKLRRDAPKAVVSCWRSGSSRARRRAERLSSPSPAVVS